MNIIEVTVLATVATAVYCLLLIKARTDGEKDGITQARKELNNTMHDILERGVTLHMLADKETVVATHKNLVIAKGNSAITVACDASIELLLREHLAPCSARRLA